MRFLFVDQILKRDHPRHISGIKHITPEDRFLYQNSENGPLCFMPSLIGETIGQLAAWSVMHEQGFLRRPVAGVVAAAIMYKEAKIGDSLLLECQIDALDEVAVEYHGHASVNGELVFSVVGAIGPMLPMSQFIDESLVRQQFAEIDRPIEAQIQPYYSSLPKIDNPYTPCEVFPVKFDAILDMIPNQSCRGIKKVSRAALYFADHFPNKPVLPLTILLEFIRNMATQFMQASDWPKLYRLAKMERIKMSEFVMPGEVVESQLMVKKLTDTQLILHIRSFVNQKRVCVVDLVYEAEV